MSDDTVPTSSAEVRSHLIDALQLDLVGPRPDDSDRAQEILDQAPSKWYLTGFLVPHGAPVEQRSDDTGNDELDLVGSVKAGDDENVPEKAFARKAFFPSSMGLSLLVSERISHLNVTVEWGDYSSLKDISNEADLETEDTEKQNRLGYWQRIPRQATISVSLHVNAAPTQLGLDLSLSSSEQLKIPLYQSHAQSPTVLPVPNSNGLQLVISTRPITSQELLPDGTRSVSVFLVNNRPPSSDKERDTTYTFQTTLSIHAPEPLVPRPNLRGRADRDWDENVADLQYRDDYEYAVGHNVSAIAITNPDGNCQQVHTAWIPTADVEKVIPNQVKNTQMGMEAIADAATPAALQDMLSPIVDDYAQWIDKQRTKCLQESKRSAIAHDLLNRAERAKKRISAGIQTLSDPQVFLAFCIANRAMATAIRQRATHGKSIEPESVAPPQWRPFQLAFLLMNLAGIANPEDNDRETVDLLFFPTGGGKTEAYLGLPAFTLVLRRLHHPGI